MSDSLKNKILLYHGSREIVEYPEIRLHRFNKDFYFGFYCTKIAKQAERWATRYDNKGYVNIYEYMPDTSLRIKVLFKKPTHQIRFHTVRALTTLKFVEGREVKDGER